MGYIYFGDGIKVVGFVDNLGSFFPMLGKLAGKEYTNMDKARINAYIENQWERRWECVQCFDDSGIKIDSNSSNITTILVDTGEREKNAGEKLYVRFDRSTPGSISAEGFRGGKIGTISQLLPTDTDSYSICENTKISTDMEFIDFGDGIKVVGFVDNLGSFFPMLGKLAGKEYTNKDKAEINTYIENQWERRRECVQCFDNSGIKIDSNSSNITTILVDTGECEKNAGEKLYVRFDRLNPSSISEKGFRGGKIGTISQLLPTDTDSYSVCENTNFSTKVASFERFSFVSDYSAVANAFNKLTGKNIDKESIKSIIFNAYDQANSADMIGNQTKLNSNWDRFTFFEISDFVSLTNERVFVKCTPNKNEGFQEWYGAYIVSESELQNDLLDCFVVHYGPFKFDTLVRLNEFYDDLAKKAMKEKWDLCDENGQPYKILRSYIQFTYLRLVDEDKNGGGCQKKIEQIDNKVFFNSGLLDRMFRQIIIVGDDCILKQDVKGFGECSWQLIENPIAYSENDMIIARNIDLKTMVKPATFFTDCREVVFDANLDIKLNDDHVIRDGVSRDRLPKYSEEYKKVKDDEHKLDLLVKKIARDIDSAIDRAKLMAQRNYKLAVPQYWKETGKIQFLLPIYIGENEEAEKPQCALVLSLDDTGRFHYYRGETILTLDMAYNNARLIAKPEVFWLDDITK